MKQFAFMIVTTFLGVGKSFTTTPVWGVAVYYMYAVIRPEFIWKWMEFGGMRIADLGWSFYVAVATLLATILWRAGVIAPTAVTTPPWYGNPRFTRSHYLFIAFVFWISLTYPTAIYPERAYPYFVEYLKIFVMFLCATLVLRTVRDVKIIYFVVLGSTGYAAYEHNAYYFFDGYMFVYKQGYGGLDNNGAALIVAMGAPLAYFAWEGIRHRIRWLFLLMIPLFIHAVMLSFSRGAMLSLCVAGLLILFRTRRKKFLLVAYALLAVFVVAAAGDEISERFFSISEHDADESANSRKTTWNIAVQMANERPLFGFGIRCSNAFTHQYGADMEGRTIHSQYLQTAADSGWVGLAFYLMLLASAFVGLMGVRRFLRQHTDPETLWVKSMASGLECSLVVFCFGAIFLSLEHFELPYILILLAVQLHAITRAIQARTPAAVAR